MLLVKRSVDGTSCLNLNAYFTLRNHDISTRINANYQDWELETGKQSFKYSFDNMICLIGIQGKKYSISVFLQLMFCCL